MAIEKQNFLERWFKPMTREVKEMLDLKLQHKVRILQ